MIPYVDATTFNEAPTGVDTTQLVPAGSTPQQSAALQNIVERASSIVDTYCYQRLAATTDLEQKRIRPNREGQIEIFTKQFPVISVLQAQWNDFSSSDSTWTPIDVTKIQPLERSILIYDDDYSWWRGVGTNPLVVQYQYQSGYPLTTLTGPGSGTSGVVPAGASTITVASTVGMTTTTAALSAWASLSELEILDGATREIVEVSAISGATLTLASPTVNQHSVGALISGVPKVVEEATILIATWMVKNPRGDASFVMSGGGVDSSRTGPTVDNDLLDHAAKMLSSFRRVL